MSGILDTPKELIDLVERFDRNKDSYTSGQYNETQVRQEFINPFFTLLGWDMDNKQGLAEAYKYVIHEPAVKVGTETKAPDYCFRIGGTSKFFLEAKRPSVNLKDDISPAFQLRRYAWSAKLPLSILTDFKEFVVYDTRIRPVISDKPATARIKYLTYEEYLKNWEEIYSTFSLDAILKGSFDKYVESTKAKKGTAEVDDAFLEEIESWRDSLAKNIALRNLKLSPRDLNFAVQCTIDRIIFLRICEDRSIEEYGKLRALTNGERVYPRLCEYFERADERYNSGLFHFSKEKDRSEQPDELTLHLKIDDKPLKEIITSLYYPDSPYEFSVLPSDILGQVYEQFLGKVIRLTDAHHAVVDDKPEVKKAGGVYYTPTYIVDYIVKNTVGKLLGDDPNRRDVTCYVSTPKQVAKLKILDPACGSGSFLLGAYQYLLDWHLKYYMDNNPEKSSAVHQTATGGWRLTTQERKRILLNNIYGVDIDTQAVEVTKLSLLLKVLEGENEQTLEKQLQLLHERALPDLGKNIKCGNSLIGPDFYDNQQLLLIDEEEKYRINVFDWNTEFPDIMKSSGFDAVIGNPPYIPIEMMTDEQRIYYQDHYSELERKYDSSIIFILALLKKLKSSGRLGFISSLTWWTGENFNKLRKYMFTKTGVTTLINLPFDVFKNAYVDTGIYILSGSPVNKYSIFRFPKKEKSPNLGNLKYTEVPTELVKAPDYKVVLEPETQTIINRLLDNSKYVSLGSFTMSTQGLAGNRFEKENKKGSKNLYPFLESGQVYRYLLEFNQILYTDLNDKPSLKVFYEKNPKILIRRVINRQDRLMAAYIDQKMVFKKDINPFIITKPEWNPLFVLGIINSRLISYLYINTSSIATKDDFRQTTLAELRRLPIPVMKKEDLRHDRMVKLVDRMLELNQQLPKAKTPHDKESLQRQITTTDNQIDQLVYELYGLTDEEIKIINDGTK